MKRKRATKAATRARCSPGAKGQNRGYTPEKGQRMCALIAVGATVTEAARALKRNPDTLYEWIKTIPGLSEQYARAREEQLAAWEDRIVTAATKDQADPQRSRLEVDALKWLMSKRQPKKYGDSTQLNVSGTLSLEAAVRQSITGQESKQGE